MPLLEISCQRHSVFGLSVYLPKVYERNVLQTTFGNFTVFTTRVQVGTRMNWWDSEIRRSKIKVMTGPDMVKKHFEHFEGHTFKLHSQRQPFRQRHTGWRFVTKLLSRVGHTTSYWLGCWVDETTTVESRYIEVTGTAVYSSKYPRFDISV